MLSYVIIVILNDDVSLARRSVGWHYKILILSDNVKGSLHIM